MLGLSMVELLIEACISGSCGDCAKMIGRRERRAFVLVEVKQKVRG